MRNKKKFGKSRAEHTVLYSITLDLVLGHFLTVLVKELLSGRFGVSIEILIMFLFGTVLISVGFFFSLFLFAVVVVVVSYFLTFKKLFFSFRTISPDISPGYLVPPDSLSSCPRWE